MKCLLFLPLLLFPQTKGEIREYAESLAKFYGVPERVIPAIIHVESTYDKNAVSHLGAYNLMQVTKAAWQDFDDITGLGICFEQVKTNWKANLVVGSWYLRHRCYSGDWKDAILKFFWGPWNTNIKSDLYYRKVVQAIKEKK